VKTRQLGSLVVPVVGLGTNNFGTDFFGKSCSVDDAVEIVSAALDAGVNFLDTAEEYSVRSRNGIGQSEQFIGEALRRLGTRREDVIIATKFTVDNVDAPDERGAKRITRAVEGSLARLGVDHIDLYQQHTADRHTPIEETLTTLNDLVRQGKVREIGCCNFSGEQLDRARAASSEHELARFVTSQSRYNVLEGPRQEDALAGCLRNSMMLLPYYPLANGLLTGKYGKDGTLPPGSRLAGQSLISERIRSAVLTPRLISQVGMLETFAKDHGRTLLELAISWLTSQDFVGSVIAGATSAAQVTANARSASWNLTRDDLDEIAALLAPGQVDAL
jgi:aryl-alcohol dehydrogenase-like predicted oxidoreductase